MDGSNVIKAPSPPDGSAQGASVFGNFGSSGSMSTLAAGPAAELYSIMNQLMVLYNQFQAEYDAMTTAETQVQADTATAAAQGALGAASNQANSLISQAVGSALGAAVTAGSVYFTSRAQDEVSSTLNSQNQELTNLNTLNSAYKGLGPVPDSMVAEDPSQTAARVTDANQLLDNASGQNAADENAAKGVLEPLDATQRSAFREQLQKQIATVTESINTTYSQLSTKTQMYSNMSQLLNNAGQVGSQGAQAVFTQKSGEYQAAQQLTSSVNGMAGNAWGLMSGNITQFYNTAIQTIQTASKGANAYAA